MPSPPEKPPHRPLRVALLGSRGIPASYGGYETFFEEMAPRLAALTGSAEGQGSETEHDFEVTVYCRSHHTPPELRRLRRYRGVELVVLPTFRTRHLDTPVHTLLSALHAVWRAVRGGLRRPYDGALLVNGANALFLPLLSLAGVPTALHVDGIERTRSKWGRLGRTVYALSERLACRLPQVLVTDAEVIHDYYRDRYGAESVVLTYGVEPEVPTGPDGSPSFETLGRLDLEPGRYFLYVSRFEPENNPHRVAEAYRGVGGDLPLVMVGGAPYADRFIESFRRGADPRILFPGPIYGAGYRELQAHAYAYVQATEVGGTHPALVEAMGYGNCVLINDTPENREVAGEVGWTFEAARPETLTRRFEEALADPEAVRRAGAAAAERARSRYSWEAVTDRYADLFRSLAGG